jgi:tripartite-type tricarboxylate transporter receptor subunit TctC
MPGYLVEGWFAVIGPSKLPAPEVKRIHAAFVTAFADPDLKANMDKQGNVINPSSPDEALKFFRAEIAKYAKLVKKAGIKLD